MAVPPGGRVVATAVGCDPGSAAVVELGGRPVASSVADATGSFSVPLDVGDLAVDRYEVVARCGPILTTALDIVLSSQLDPGVSTIVILLLFFLMAVAAIRRQAG